MGHHLYDENKRMKAENERLREQLRERREQDSRDEAFSLAVYAFISFLRGEASLVSTPGNDPETRVIYFQMPPSANVAALDVDKTDEDGEG